MATHSSILAWKIPWTEEPGRLQRSPSFLGIFLWIVFDLKPIECQIFSRKKKKCVYGIRKKCNLKPTAVMNHLQLLSRQRKENIFKEGRKELEGGPLKNRVHGFSFPDPLPEKKRHLSSSYQALLCFRAHVLLLMAS